MTGDPYGDEIKALAAWPESKASRVDARAQLDNPLCGDRVTVELGLEDERVGTIGHAVKGCLLCRAAAAVMADAAPGLDRDGAARLLDGVSAMLKSSAEDENPALAPFHPVRPHKSRHGCILLPFKALFKALTSS